MRPVAVLRPEPGGSRTAARARALGLTAFSVPLFSVQPLAWQAPDPAAFDGLLLTSANAPRRAGEQLERLRSLPAHAVGEATAEAARAAGLVVASVGSSGVAALLASLPPELRLLHLCGQDRIEVGSRQSVTPVAVYLSDVIPHPPGIEQLAGAVALVHSPRAGRRLGELVNDRDDIRVAAISAAAAQACGEAWAAIAAAAEPTDAALLSLAGRLCQQLDPK